VEAGKFVGIVGSSGAGKSTIFHLLLRLYDPDEGTILINGIDIKEYPIRWLRRRIAFGGQMARQCTGTIESNVVLGDLIHGP